MDNSIRVKLRQRLNESTEIDKFSNLEEVLNEVDLSAFKLNDTLNTEIWVGDKIKEPIHKVLLKIANDYWESLELGFDYDEVTMTGSLANYNWSKFSDVDLHILFDTNKLDGDSELIKGLLDAKTRKWNADHDITVKGFDVELYLQDKDEPHHSTGVYSITNSDWVKEPVRGIAELDRPTIEKKYDTLTKRIGDIEKEFKNGDDLEGVIDDITKFKEKVRNMRKAGLETGGEFSPSNIVFKLLRRNDFMGKLNDMQTQAYDKSVTITENGGGKSVSVRHLKGLLNNVTNISARTTLNRWIKKAGQNDFISLTQRQYQLLQDIKLGGPKPSFYGSKN
tara:strand:+ start:425 stop:1432 length:1008 start_codon:yes stop_codon:yes gene_type:complete